MTKFNKLLTKIKKRAKPIELEMKGQTVQHMPGNFRKPSGYNLKMYNALNC